MFHRFQEENWPVSNIFFAMAILPQAVSTVFKEIAFRGYDGDLDVNVLQFWVAVFQVAVNFICMPVYTLPMLGTQRVPLEEMPNIALGGSKCLFVGQDRAGTSLGPGKAREAPDQVVENCGLPDEKPCDNCEKALVPVRKLQAIMRGVREIELDLEEICKRSSRVKENVENMLSSYTPTYIEEKDASVLGTQASASQSRIMPSKSYLNLAVVPKVDDQLHKNPELKGCKRIVADPHSEFRLVWSLVAVLLVVFDAISIPVMVSWEIPSSELVGESRAAE
eukprot:s1891_g11.t1